jgi:hypothetical protein
MAGMDDMMLPVHYAGNVVINLRTYPIRINSNKYLDGERHMTWDEVQKFDREKKPYQVVKYDSGPGYPDQEETTWDEVTKASGSKTPIMEITSVTKLPRRVFTFSKQNLKQTIEYNRGNGWTFLSVNFVNYLDSDMTGRRGMTHLDNTNDKLITQKVKDWLYENILDVFKSELCVAVRGAAPAAITSALPTASTTIRRMTPTPLAFVALSSFPSEWI